MSGSILHPKKFSRDSQDEGAAADMSSYSIIENAESASDTEKNHHEDVNRKLFARLAELRQRNLELRKFEELSWEKDLEIVKLRSVEGDLRKQLESIRSSHELSQDRRECYIREITTLQVEITRHETELKTLSDRHDVDLKIAKDDFNRKLAQMQDANWEKDLQVKTLVSEKAEFADAIQSLQQIRLEREAQVNRAHERITALTASLTETRGEIQRLREMNASHQQISDLKASELSERRNAEIRRHEEVCHRLEIQIVALKDSRAQVEDDLAQANQGLGDYRREIEALQARIIAIGTETEKSLKAREDAFNIERRTMSEQKSNELRALSSEFESRIATLQSEHAGEVDAYREIERDLNEKLIRLRVETGGQTKHIESLNQNIRDLRQTLLNAQSAHKETTEELRTRLAELAKRDEEIGLLRKTEIELVQQLASERSALRQAETRIDELRTRGVDLSRTDVELRDRLAIREEAHRNSQRTVEDLGKKVAELTSQVDAKTQALQNTLERSRETEIKLQNEINQERLARQEEVIARGIQQQAQAADVRRTQDEWTAIKTKLETTISELKFELASTIERHEKVQRELMEMNRDLNQQLHLQRQNDAELLAELSDCRYEIKRLETEYSAREKTALAENERAVTAIRTDAERAMTKLQAERDQAVSLLKSEREQMATVLAAQEKVTSALQAGEARSADKIVELEANLDSASAEMATLRRALAIRANSQEAEMKEAEQKYRELHSELASREAQMNERESLTSVRESQSSVREHQLKQYAIAITEQKAELVRQTKRLAEEIQMAGKMHPLKDYLQLTEFELSKVEVQLKLTPTLSVDRARLEACVKQMVEQRDFLKHVVAATEKRFDEQADSILQLIRNPKLASTPPPPPKVRVKTEPKSKPMSNAGPTEGPVLST